MEAYKRKEAIYIASGVGRLSQLKLESRLSVTVDDPTLVINIAEVDFQERKWLEKKSDRVNDHVNAALLNATYSLLASARCAQSCSINYFFRL